MQETDLKQIDNFIDTQQHLSPYTRKAYQHDLKLLSDFCNSQGIKQWCKIDTGQIRTFVAWRHRQGISGKSLQRNLSSVRAFYRYLIEQRVTSHNPAQGVIAPKIIRKLPKVLDVDQASQLVDIHDKSALSVRDRAMLELMYSSGLRLSELIQLNMEHLDLTDALVSVTGKGKKTRSIPVGRYAIVALRNWIAIRQDIADENEQAVFVSQRGKRLNPRTFQQRLKQWAIRQGLATHVHPHMLRHSFASHMLESSSDLRAVQELLGHADISTTQIYTHLDFQHLAKVYDTAHPRARKKKS